MTFSVGKGLYKKRDIGDFDEGLSNEFFMKKERNRSRLMILILIETDFQ